MPGTGRGPDRHSSGGSLAGLEERAERKRPTGMAATSGNARPDASRCWERSNAHHETITYTSSLGLGGGKAPK